MLKSDFYITISHINMIRAEKKSYPSTAKALNKTNLIYYKKYIQNVTPIWHWLIYMMKVCRMFWAFMLNST